MARPSADDRFWAKVDRTGSWWERDGCWQWLGSRDRFGYGGFWNGQKLCRAHRWSYERFVGPIPEGLHLDHLCKNPSCVNPAHLEPVTPRDNALRSNSANAINHRKLFCKRDHRLQGDNVLWYKGRRSCRECRHNAWVERVARDPVGYYARQNVSKRKHSAKLQGTAEE